MQTVYIKVRERMPGRCVVACSGGIQENNIAGILIINMQKYGRVHIDLSHKQKDIHVWKHFTNIFFFGGWKLVTDFSLLHSRIWMNVAAA